MAVTLGVDIGTSAMKIAGLDRDGGIRPAVRVQAGNPAESLYGAVGRRTWERAERFALTGVGADLIGNDVFAKPVHRVGEFDATAAGALYLSGEPAALVVSMGTGTAFLWAASDGTAEHLCGSGIGGGTLSGLCRTLAGAGEIEAVQRLADAGDLSRVDLTIGDVLRTPVPTLDPSLTASNFGRLSADASPADLTAGAMNLVLQAVGTMTVLAARCCGTKTVVLTGSVAALPQARANFETFERLYGLHYIIPEHAAFATAIGAALCALRGTHTLASSFPLP